MATIHGISPFGLLKVAASNLRVNWLRSMLTVLGMTFGTASVIATLSSNDGSKQYITAELSKLGTNILTIQANGMPLSASDSGLLLKYSDLIQSVSYALALPAISVRKGALASERQVVGADVNLFEDLRLPLAKGRYFDARESQKAEPVAVLGATAARDMFGKDNPVGQVVLLVVEKSFFPIRIIGVLREKGINSGINFDVNLYLPPKLALTLDNGTARRTLFATLKKDDDTAEAKKEIAAILNGRLAGALQISDAREALERTHNIWSNQNLVGMILAAISLITGGVGIMNVMLLSIYQRKSEIGLRKALGASNATICNQFLLEAVIICTLGGMVGVGLGCIFGQRVASLLGDWEATLSLSAIGLAMGSSTLTGLLFGLAPALRASQLDPYDALRG